MSGRYGAIGALRLLRQLGQDTALQTGQVLSGHVSQTSGQQSATVFG
jgi:hypothetical protein